MRQRQGFRFFDSLVRDQEVVGSGIPEVLPILVTVTSQVRFSLVPILVLRGLCTRLEMSRPAHGHMVGTRVPCVFQLYQPYSEFIGSWFTEVSWAR